VYASVGSAFAIGEAGQLFSWGSGEHGPLGHGDERNQPSPKRIEALRDVQVSSVSAGRCHVLALTEDGLVYSWGENNAGSLLGNPHVERELLPKPIEALRGVRVGSIAVQGHRCYAVADTGELWAWGCDGGYDGTPLGHDHCKQVHCPLPKRINSLRGIRSDAVAAYYWHTMALPDEGFVYSWGHAHAALSGALGLSLPRCYVVLTPQRIPALHVTYGL
jgi:alpha-tubulin suppressor-like RCC1 family protein